MDLFLVIGDPELYKSCCKIPKWFRCLRSLLTAILDDWNGDVVLCHVKLVVKTCYIKHTHHDSDVLVVGSVGLFIVAVVLNFVFCSAQTDVYQIYCWNCCLFCLKLSKIISSFLVQVKPPPPDPRNSFLADSYRHPASRSKPDEVGLVLPDECHGNLYYYILNVGNALTVFIICLFFLGF